MLGPSGERAIAKGELGPGEGAPCPPSAWPSLSSKGIGGPSFTLGPGTTGADRARRGRSRNLHVPSREGGLTLRAGLCLHQMRHSGVSGRLIGSGGRTNIWVRRSCRSGSPGPPALSGNMTRLVAAAAFPLVRALFNSVASLPADGAHGGLASVPHPAVKARHPKGRWNFPGDGHSDFPGARGDLGKSVVGYLNHLSDYTIRRQQLPHRSVGHLTRAVTYIHQTRARIGRLDGQSFLLTSTSSRSIKRKKNLANIQPS